MTPSDIEELRKLTDALGSNSEQLAEFPALTRLVELAGEMAHESREPVATTVVNGGPDLRPIHAFVARVAGAAGLMRSLPVEDGDKLPPLIKAGIQELGMALSLLESGK